jgi:hypothetical protein
MWTGLAGPRTLPVGEAWPPSLGCAFIIIVKMGALKRSAGAGTGCREYLRGFLLRNRDEDVYDLTVELRAGAFQQAADSFRVWQALPVAAV